MTATVSAVIPTIGRDVLDQSICSALEQTTPFDEVIVFDNSVTQDIQGKSIFRNDVRVKWHTSGSQLDIISSWNTAARHSSSDFIYMMGDDDLMTPDFCRKVKERISDDIELILAPMQFMDYNGKILPPLFWPLCSEYTGEQLREITMRHPGLTVALGLPVFRRSLFEKVGGYKNILPKGLFMDYLFLWESTAFCNKVLFIPENLWLYRVAPPDWSGSITDFSEKVKFIRKIPELFEYVERTLVGNGVPEDKVFFPDKSAVLEYEIRTYVSEFLKGCSSLYEYFTLISFGNYTIRDKFYLFRRFLKVRKK